MAATNKCLAQRKKSKSEGEATKNRNSSNERRTSADMTTQPRPPRLVNRDSHSPMLLAIAVALGLVVCMLFAQPLRRAYLWIAAAELRLPIDASQSNQKLPKSE